MFNIENFTESEFETIILTLVGFKQHLELCLDVEGHYDIDDAIAVDSFVNDLDALLFKIKQIQDNKSTIQ